MHMMTAGAPRPWMALPEVYRILVKRLRTDTDSCRAHERAAESTVGRGPRLRAGGGPEWALLVPSDPMGTGCGTLNALAGVYCDTGAERGCGGPRVKL